MNRTPYPEAAGPTDPRCTHDQLLRLLDELDISHSTVNHEPMYTVTDSKKLRSTDTAGGYTKNLFLRNKKGIMWLVTCNEDRQVDLRRLAHALGAGRFSFGSIPRLMRFLGVQPGAVSPLALVNDTGCAVRFAIDVSLLDHKVIHLHPLDNCHTTTLKVQSLLQFAEHTGHSPVHLEFGNQGDVRQVAATTGSNTNKGAINVTHTPEHDSLLEIFTAFRNGQLKPSILNERIAARHDETLGAYKHWLPDRARATAMRTDQIFAEGGDLGPLQGIPVSIKDLYNVKGLQTFAGSPTAIPDKLMAEGPLISDLARQQAIFTGKTHTVEFAFGGLGVNSHWGTPRNPWDATEHRVSGGSSSGAGVSLKEGTALLALGSDTAGSVRIPASMTGNVGLKTSYGRWSLNGIFPLSPTLDTAGILTRTVADAVFAFAAMDPAHQNRSLEFVEQSRRCDPQDFAIGRGDPLLWAECDSGIVEAVETALAELSRKGVRQSEVEMPEVTQAVELLRAGNVTAAEIHEFLSSEMPAWKKTLDPLIAPRILGGSDVKAAEYLARRRQITQLQTRANQRFGAFDLIASPTVPITPPRLADVEEIEGYSPLNLMALRNTCSGNTLGLCSITLPVGLDAAGMPVGLQLMSPHGSEEKLLAAALCIERLIGSSAERLGRPPMISD